MSALSNTIIGVALLAGGAFGLAAAAFGPAAVLLAFATMCGFASVTALGLDEVQR